MATLAQPQAKAEGAPFAVVRTKDRQQGLLLGFNHNRSAVRIKWHMAEEFTASHGGSARPVIEADLDEVFVTDGIASGEYALLSPAHQFEPRQMVKFTLTKELHVPPPGEAIELPDGVRAMCVTASTGKPVLVMARGMLVSWVPAKGHGYIVAHGEHGGKTNVYVKHTALMDERGLPMPANVRPVVQVPVVFTARCSAQFRLPTAERVLDITGGPIKLMPEVEGDEEALSSHDGVSGTAPSASGGNSAAATKKKQAAVPGGALPMEH